MVIRIWLFVVLSIAVSVGIVAWQTPVLGLGPALLVGFLVFLLLYALSMFPLYRAEQHFSQALAIEDTTSARKHMAEIKQASFFSPLHRRYLPQWEATVLMIEDRFADALAIVQADHVHDELSLYERNALAWCLAHTGDAVRAIQIESEVLRELDKERNKEPTSALYPYALGTLGTAYLHAGDPTRAVALLERSLACGEENPRAQATRAFYLGEGFRALGTTEAARQAYQRAIQELPTSKYALRAQTRLRDLPTGAQ